MNTSELIRSRRSVRTFDGRSIEPDITENILEYAKNAENPYGIPIEWKILNSEKDRVSSPVIVGTDTFIAGKMKRIPHAEEAFGYSFEKVVLFALSLGIGTTWIAGTMPRSAFEKAMNLGADEVMPCMSPLGYIAKKMSVRETMMRNGIKADTRFDFSALFFDGSFDNTLQPGNMRDLKLPLELVRLSPSAVNKQPWRVVVDGEKVHFYEKRSKGYVTNGWDTQKIDMGIAICHFVCGLDELNIKASMTVSDPCIACPAETNYIATFTIQ
jgi:nitroreductase